TETSPELRANSTQLVSSGISQLNDAEYLKFLDDITQANTNGQYDELLSILAGEYTSDDLIKALDKLSDEEYDTLCQIFDFSHDEYQSDAGMARANKTLNLLDDIDDLDFENAENFTEILKFFNDGRLDNIVDLLINSENHTMLDLYHEINQLSDEDFESFYKFIQLLDEHDGDDQDDSGDIISVITDLPNTISKIVSGDNNKQSSSNTHSKVSYYKSEKIFDDDDDDDISFSPSKIGLIRELLTKYFDGEITFDQLVEMLNDEGIDTSELKQNDDGSLSWFGLDSIIAQDIPEDADTNSTADADDSQPTADDDTTEYDPIVDESGMDDIKIFDESTTE
ncbi:MAG: hypothetical protein J6S29_02625, partial [Methanosphaera sp.]|nr:hypothetical protein [Methanosphaera sp.]